MEELDEPMLSDVSIFRKVLCEKQSLHMRLGLVGKWTFCFIEREPIPWGLTVALTGLLLFGEYMLLPTRVSEGTCLATYKCESTNGKVAGANVEVIVLAYVEDDVYILELGFVNLKISPKYMNYLVKYITFKLVGRGHHFGSH